MRITRASGYAIQAVCQLAQCNGHAMVPSHELAAEGGMPEKFLLEVLRNLVNAGVLASQRGPVGGYQLAKLPEEITVLDVVEAVDGPLTDVWSSVERTDYLPTVGFAADRVFELLTNCVRNQFSSVTVGDLLTEKLNGNRFPAIDGQAGLALLPWPTHDGGWSM